MGKLRASLFAGLISIGLSAPVFASPDWTISLGGTDGTASFDVTGGVFASFLVIWHGPANTYTIDMTGPANSPGATLTGGSLPAACGTPTGQELSYLLMTQDACLSGGTFGWTGRELGNADKVKFDFTWNDGGIVTLTQLIVFQFDCRGASCPNGSESGTWVITGRPAVVPEPASIALLGLGLAGLGLVRRRRLA